MASQNREMSRTRIYLLGSNRQSPGPPSPIYQEGFPKPRYFATHHDRVPGFPQCPPCRRHYPGIRRDGVRQVRGCCEPGNGPWCWEPSTRNRVRNLCWRKNSNRRKARERPSSDVHLITLHRVGVQISSYPLSTSRKDVPVPIAGANPVTRDPTMNIPVRSASDRSPPASQHRNCRSHRRLRKRKGTTRNGPRRKIDRGRRSCYQIPRRNRG